jgi:hypothetical protein
MAPEEYSTKNLQPVELIVKPVDPPDLLARLHGLLKSSEIDIS